MQPARNKNSAYWFLGPSTGAGDRDSPGDLRCQGVDAASPDRPVRTDGYHGRSLGMLPNGRPLDGIPAIRALRIYRRQENPGRGYIPLDEVLGPVYTRFPDP